MSARWIVKKAARAGVALSSVGSGALHLRRSLRPGPRVRVLTYHRFGDVPGDAFWVSAAHFEEQVKWLAEQGLAVSLRDVQEFVAGRQALPDGAALITIDDGSYSTLSIAAPILAKYSVPAVAYITSSLIGLGDLGHGERFMSWDELRHMAEAGIEVGSHAFTHRSLGKMPLPEARSEARQSKVRLEQELGREVSSFAYPFGTHGDFTEGTEAALREAGYSLAFNSQHGALRPGMDPISLPRVKIEGGEALWMFQLAARGAMDAWRVVDRNLWRFQRVRTEISGDDALEG